MMVDVVAAVVAFVLAALAIGLYRAAQRAERRICEQLHHDRVDRLIERAAEVREHLHEINGCGERDKAKREVAAALAASDEQERERVKAADYVWGTDGSDGGQSSGDAEVATVGALASLLSLFGTWWARMLLFVLVAAMLLLVLVSPQTVMVVPQEPRGNPPHRVVQTAVPESRLLYVMEDMYRESRRRSRSREQFSEDMRQLFLVAGLGAGDAVKATRAEMIRQYPKERNP